MNVPSRTLGCKLTCERQGGAESRKHSDSETETNSGALLQQNVSLPGRVKAAAGLQTGLSQHIICTCIADRKRASASFEAALWIFSCSVPSPPPLPTTTFPAPPSPSADSLHWLVLPVPEFLSPPVPCLCVCLLRQRPQTHSFH